MPWPFPTPPLELLSADGSLVTLTERRGGRPRVLLARELCSFERFEPPGARTAADQAARFHARSHAPFHNAGQLVRRDGAGYAIWSWDQDRIESWLAARFGAARPPVAPETLAQPPGAAWRVVRLASGFELQCWRARVLVASAWRAAAPDDATWTAFARQQRNPDTPPPTAAPAPESLPVVAEADLGEGGGWADVSPASTLKLGLTVVGGMAAAATVFWIGQGLRLDGLATALERHATTERAAIAPLPHDAALRSQIAAYQALGARPDPFVGLKTAVDVLRRHHLQAKGFSIDGPVVTVTVPYTALGAVGEVVQELQGTGAYAEVRPLSDSAANAINIEMTLVGATPSEPAAANPGG
jgi:hypothetical protein